MYDCALVEVTRALVEGTFSFLSVDLFVADCSYLARAVCVSGCKCLLWAAVCIDM